MNGLDSNRTPFKYLDELINAPDWEKLHSDICLGIAKSNWNKRFVSSGVHPEWAHLEITPYMREVQNNLDSYSLESYAGLSSTDERLKYLLAWGPVPHPFWVLFLRNNRRIERTGILNKSVGEDCEWTDDSKNFQSLVTFINQLPFREIGRVILFMTEARNATLPHFDAATRWERPHDDFIWFTTKPGTKKIYVLDEDTNTKHYPEHDKKFIWFNEMDYHGTDAVDHFSFSVRIDGKFKQDIRDLLTK